MLFAVNRILTGENCSESNSAVYSNAALPLTTQIPLLSSIHACKTKYMLLSALLNHDQDAQNLQYYIRQGLFPLSLIHLLIFIGMSLSRPLQPGSIKIQSKKLSNLKFQTLYCMFRHQGAYIKWDFMSQNRNPKQKIAFTCSWILFFPTQAFILFFGDLYRNSIVRDLLLDKTNYSHLLDKNIYCRFDTVTEISQNSFHY